MLQHKLKKIFLILGDLLVLSAALYVTLSLRFLEFPSAHVWNAHFEPFAWLFAFWLIVLYVNGLYELWTSQNDIAFYNKLLRNILINFSLGAAYFYLLTGRLFNIKPQTVYFIFMGVALVLFSLWRYAYNRLVQRPNFLRNVLVIGMKDEAWELINEISKKPQLGYRIAAVIHNHNPITKNLPNVNFYDSGVEVKQVLQSEKITTVVTSLDPRGNPALVKSLFDSLSYKIQFFDLPTFYEKLTGKIPVTTIGHIWFLENLAEADKGMYELGKRIFDLSFAVLGLAITMPLIPFVAFLIRMDSRGSLFFKQVRVGYLGKTFRAIKFRSMISGAESDGQAQWAQKNDPRVTKIGRFLRNTRLDEIPQLVNIIKGEMSVIGPRPERPEFVKQLQEIIPFYNERHLVKPGLTGWAQINFQYGSSAGDALKKLQYDLFYIKNRSAPLDAGIMLKTINIILSGKGQ
ncbi:MAG: sugar transferase [bacterium]|nr:sugar transferase [bacterium]